MKCKEILENTRMQRAQELEEYLQNLSKIVGVSPGHIEYLMQYRKSTLALELPFKTDTVSVNHALVNPASSKGDSGEERSLERWVKNGIKKNKEGNYDTPEFYNRISFERFITSESIWPKAVTIMYSSSGERIDTLPENIPLEDFSLSLPRETILENIEKSKQKKSSKLVNKSRFRNLIRFIGEEKNYQEMEIPREQGGNEGHTHGAEIDEILQKFYDRAESDDDQLPNESVGALIGSLPENIIEGHSTRLIDASASLFNYLEERAMKSGSPEHYRDLVEVRWLLYVPLETPVLNNITNSGINRSLGYLSYDGYQYRLPNSFVELVRAVCSEGEPLVKRDYKQLNRFIDRMVIAAKLAEKVTPKLIRKVRSLVAEREGCSEKQLPQR